MRTRKWSQEMNRILEAQRMVSLDTCSARRSSRQPVEGRESSITDAAQSLTSRYREIQLPRARSHRREKYVRVWLLDREARGECTQDQSARSHREGRQRSGEVQGHPRPAGAVPARHAGGLHLRALRAAGSTDPSHQSAICSRRTISSACRARTRPGDHTELFGTGWPSNGGGRLVGSLPESVTHWPKPSRTSWSQSGPGPDLGRSGSADDPQREGSALVERDSGATALGRPAFACQGKRCWPSPRSTPLCVPNSWTRSSRHAAPARVRTVNILLERG